MHCTGVTLDVNGGMLIIDRIRSRTTHTGEPQNHATFHLRPARCSRWPRPPPSFVRFGHAHRRQAHAGSRRRRTIPGMRRLCAVRRRVRPNRRPHRDQVAHSAQLGDDAAMITALRSGTLDLSANSRGAWPAVVPRTPRWACPSLFADAGKARRWTARSGRNWPKSRAKGHGGAGLLGQRHPPRHQRQAAGEGAGRPQGPEDPYAARR